MFIKKHRIICRPQFHFCKKKKLYKYSRVYKFVYIEKYANHTDLWLFSGNETGVEKEKNFDFLCKSVLFENGH